MMRTKQQHVSGKISAALMCGGLALMNFAQAQNVLPAAQTGSSWYTEAETLVQTKVGQSRDTATAKNIILFVGDGMGISTLTAARILEGQMMSQTGEENNLSFETFPYTALAKTYNTNQQTPDSAGTMTAMMSGVKTKAGVIGVSDQALRGNCLSTQGNELVSALDLAEAKGKATGVVTTARLTHATPAATYAHVPERNWEDDSKLPAEAVTNGCKDIAWQLVKMPHGDGLEVAMGGGRRHFLPETITDGEGSKGRRKDGVDLTAAWLADYPNATYVSNQSEFDAVDATTTQHLLGLFESSHMEYEADRANDTGGEPSLSEMTTKAIDILDNNANGFFLMVESGRIDHGHHAGNAYRALTDTIEFSKAVQAAVDNTNPAETLIIVTADHSHVFTIAGYPTRGNPILGLVEGNDSSGSASGENSLDLNDLPYTTLGYANGPGYGSFGDATYTAGSRVDLSAIDTNDMNFRQESRVPLSSETHAGEDISIHATGPGAYLIQGVMEQNAVFHLMNQAGNLGGSKY